MDIKLILEQHKLWLNSGIGKEADLRWANLREANLQGADLRGADLRWADLRWANLVTFQLGQHQAIGCSELLTIGCERHSWAHWLENYEEIGSKNMFSDEEIKEHQQVIDCMYKIVQQRLERKNGNA